MTTQPTLFFYDLETSGFDPKSARIMQFGGQRTNLDLKPIGKPHDILIKLTEDVLPDPRAIMITGISPQMTLANGQSEAEFLKLFSNDIATPGTILVGFNNIRFDDEFIRYLHYRNFYDPYEWHWQDGRSRWDLLDLARMTRALRPEGLKWPFGPDGTASNRLELLTAINKLQHTRAHDALSDVNASIAIAQLIKNKQPKLFDFLFSMRDKQKVSELVFGGEPFIYTSGKYPGEFEKTTVVAVVTPHPQKKGALVFDLRHDPAEFENLTPTQLAEAWKWHPDESELKLPVKTLQFNRCPAVAPVSVLDKKSQQRLGLDLEIVMKNNAKLKTMKDWSAKLLEALEIMDKKRQATLLSDEQVVDSRLYEGFFSDSDRRLMSVVRSADPSELKNLQVDFKDDRLRAMLTLYKARNFPDSLTTADQTAWRQYKANKLLKGGSKSALALYQKSLEETKQDPSLNGNQKQLVKALEQWVQTVNA